jgi:predicted Fe-S protein YdhL (DUF1289 family)
MADSVEPNASPCIDLCEIDENTNLCLGCCRTIEEITFWSSFTHDEKKHVLEQLVERKKTCR